MSELRWLRDHGIQIVITLAEKPLRRDWVNDVGLMVVNMPVEDMTAPTQEQLDQCLGILSRASSQKKFGALVHCTAGLGRTGTVLASWYVARGLTAAQALAKVRELRPGSVETKSQELAVAEFAERRHRPRDAGGWGE